MALAKILTSLKPYITKVFEFECRLCIIKKMDVFYSQLHQNYTTILYTIFTCFYHVAQKFIIQYNHHAMNKIINIKEYIIDKNLEKVLEDFIPIWKEYWDDNDDLIFGQMFVSTRLLQLAVIADEEHKHLDKKCKRAIILELREIIKLLEDSAKK